MTATRFRFRRSQRLRGRTTFRTVLDGRARADLASLSIHGIPNGGATHRLGISIGRRVGSAAVRNRIKRLIREAYRLSQHELPAEAPAPYDLVVVVRPHIPLGLDDYRTALHSAVQHLHATWKKRLNRTLAAGNPESQPDS